MLISTGLERPRKTGKQTKHKAKRVAEDPFASDDEDDTKEETKRGQEVKAKKATQSSKERRMNDSDQDEKK